LRERPSVSQLQVMGENLMIDLRELFPFSGTWDRPVVHRVLELLYGDLALAQLGSAICELFFREVSSILESGRDAEQL